MHAHNATNAYAAVTKSVLEPRGIEYKAFLQTNGRLIAAKSNSRESFSEIAEAVHQNDKLWTILAADAATESNSLPEALRAQIISLAIYAHKTGRAVLRGETELDELIEINSAVMQGLNGEPGTEQPIKGAA